MADINNIKFEPHLIIKFGNKDKKKDAEKSAILIEGDGNEVMENNFFGFSRAIKTKGQKNKIFKNKIISNLKKY